MGGASASKGRDVGTLSSRAAMQLGFLSYPGKPLQQSEEDFNIPERKATKCLETSDPCQVMQMAPDSAGTTAAFGRIV